MRFAGKAVWTGNAVWFVFGGAFTAFVWLIGAALFAVSIVGLPLARAATGMAKLSALPFGKDVAPLGDQGKREHTAPIGYIVNFVWLFTFGLLLFLVYLVLGILYCLSIIGMPYGIRCFKLAGISLWPVDRCVIYTKFAGVARQQAAVERFARHRGQRYYRRDRQSL